LTGDLVPSPANQGNDKAFCLDSRRLIKSAIKVRLCPPATGCKRRRALYMNESEIDSRKLNLQLMKRDGVKNKQNRPHSVLNTHPPQCPAARLFHSLPAPTISVNLYFSIHNRENRPPRLASPLTPHRTYRPHTSRSI
jgi:hypothetical protein